VLEPAWPHRCTRADQAEEEADDPVPVDGHVQRQEKDEEQVAENAQAGDGDAAQRLAGPRRCSSDWQQGVDLVVEADLVAADGVQAVLVGLERLT